MKFKVESARFSRLAWLFLLAIGAFLSGGCASPGRPNHAANPAPAPAIHRKVEDGRKFSFEADTFFFANDLVWEYFHDANGKWRSRRREPPPSYTHHCFVVVRSARQFFEHARFDPSRPVADAATYRRLIRKIVSRSPRTRTVPEGRIVIPGYANLREFSRAQAAVLQEAMGGAWHSYWQRGHWRMMLPFSRRGQEAMASQFVREIRANHPPIVHLTTFPKLTINHAVLLLDVLETDAKWRFVIYDPNKPDAPKELIYDRKARSFHFPANDYFVGGRVNVYEIYHAWNY